MTVTSFGDSLVRELLANPSKFAEEGRTYDLLQQYFRGYPIETLRPLLVNENVLVQREAAWVASELGDQGCSLLHQIIPLIDSRDPLIQWRALEVVIVCSIGEDVNEFIYIPRSLESEDWRIRFTAMNFMANADQSQLAAGLRLAKPAGPLSEKHRYGLKQLLKCDCLESEEIQRMIEDGDSLNRKYGVVAAKRLFKKFPELLAIAAVCPDPDVNRFAKESLEDTSALAAEEEKPMPKSR